MIKSYNLRRVRLMSFFQNMVNVKNFLESEDLDTLLLKNVSNEFIEHLEAFDKALKPFRKSGLTEVLGQLDEKRDTSLVGFAAHCRLFANFPDEAKAKAAKHLLLIIDKYGNTPQEKPLLEETAIIHNMLQDFNTEEVKIMIAEIGANKWIEDLKAANEEFTQVHNDRTRIDASVIVGQTKDARLRMHNVFYKLVKTINALAFLNGNAPYQKLIDNINLEVKKARTSATQVGEEENEEA